MLHRDLKPSNILLDEEGQPHVTDFGLARLTEQNSDLTQSGAVMGTPSYMAPEQATGKTKQITTATDVWALGVVLYELLTGSRPFQAGSAIEILRLVLDQEPSAPCQLTALGDRDLEIICLKCLEKDSSRRYAAAEALAKDLERWLDGEPIIARSCTLVERTVKWVRRRPDPVLRVACLPKRRRRQVLE